MRRAALLAAAAALALPTGAAANGDPASDVLAMQDVYFPYAPPTSKHIKDALEESTDRGGPSPLLYVSPAILLFVAIAAGGRIAARRAAEADAEE